MVGCLARPWRTGASLGQGRRHERTGKSIGKSGCHPYRRRRIVDISANVARHFYGGDNRREFVMWNIFTRDSGAYRGRQREDTAGEKERERLLFPRFSTFHNFENLRYVGIIFELLELMSLARFISDRVGSENIAGSFYRCNVRSFLRHKCKYLCDVAMNVYR